MRQFRQSFIRCLISLVIVAGLQGVSLAAPAAVSADASILALTNPGFESGNLTGWAVTSGHVEVLQSSNFSAVPNVPITPTDGNYMALLSNGPGEINPAELDNLDGDLGPNNDNDRSTLSQSFNVTADQLPYILAFDWSWLTSESPTPGNFDDFFLVRLNGANILTGSAASGGVSPFPDVPVSGVEYTVNSSGSTNGSFFNDGWSGWKHFSYTITTPGAYSLSLTVSDQGNSDHLIDSGLLVDNFQAAQAADLVLFKSASPDPVVIAGEELIYTLTVVNQGPAAASDVVVTDTLPLELDYLESTEGCSLTAGQLNCPLGELAAIESRQIVIKTRAPADLVAAQADGTLKITNTAAVSSSSIESSLANNTASLSTLVQDLADLRVTKVSEPQAPVQAGETLTYTVFVDNLGPSYARSVRFTDQLLSSGTYSVVNVINDPVRLDACATSPAPGIPTTSSTINCSLTNPLEPIGVYNSTGRWMVKVVLQPTTAPDISGVTDAYTAQDSSGNPGTPDPDLSSNQAVDFIPVLLTADLQVSAVFTAEVQVSGSPGAILDIDSLPPMPASPDYASSTSAVTAGRRIQWSVQTINAGPSTAQNARLLVTLPYGVSLLQGTLDDGAGSCLLQTPHTLLCEYGELAVGASAALSFQALIDPGVPQGPQPAIGVYASSETFDSDLSSNLASQGFTVNTWADLAVQKYGNSSAIPAGSLTSYDITYQHKGPSTARGVLLTDILPPGITPLSVQVIDGALTPADCQIRAGDPALVDSLVCELGDLAPGASGRLVLQALVHPDAAPGPASNQVTITTSTLDPYSGDNADAFETTISALADLEIVKTGDPDKVAAGGQVKFTLTVTNHGPSDALGVVITDTLPLGMIYETSNLPGPTAQNAGQRWLPDQPAAPDSDLDCLLVSTAPDVVACTIASLPAGRTRLIEIYALVDPDTLPGVELVNYAEVTSQTTDPDPQNNQDNATTYVLGVDLAISKTALGQIMLNGQPFEGGIVGGVPLEGAPDQVAYGLLLTYTLTVTNQGYTMAQNVVVSDWLPNGVSLVSLSPSQGRCTPGIPHNPAYPVTCNLGSLAGGGSAVIIIVVRASYAPPGDILSNQVQVSCDQPDPNNSNNIDFNFTRVMLPWWQFYAPVIQIEVAEP